MNKVTIMPQRIQPNLPLTPAPLGSISPRGWLLRELTMQKNGLSGHIDEIWPDLGPDSGWLGGRGENWERGPYYLDGLIPLAYSLNDEPLKQKAHKWIEWMLSSQREDGFFGPADNLDWWPRIVALKVLTQYHEATGDPRALDLMGRYFRFQLAQLSTQPLAMWAAPRGQEQLLPMLYLYRKTGAEYLAPLAALLREQSYDWSAIFRNFPYEKTTHAYLNRPLFMAVKRMTLLSDWTAKRLKRLHPVRPPKRKTKAQIEQANASPFLRVYHETHSVNLAMALKMPALDALWGGDADGAAASRAGLDAIMQYHGLSNGLFSGDEHLNGRSPAVGAELCLAAELLFSLETLLCVTRDARYAERIEQIAYSAWPAMFTADMCAHQYVQQVNQAEISRKKRGWYDAYHEANLFGLAPNFGCCAANMHQGWPKLLSSLAMTTPDGVCLPVYAPFAAAVSIDCVAVHLREETNYPFDGKIVITLEHIANHCASLPFSLRLRVPSWAETLTLNYNGAALMIEPESGYLTLNRIFRAGDVIVLDFLMPLRMQREPSGGATLWRGPLLLALPIAAEQRVLRGTPPFADYALYPRAEWRYAVIEDMLSRAEITLREPGELPFDEAAPPLRIRLSMARAPHWSMERGSAGAVPEPFAVSAADQADITLVPYGCTRLRIAQFPIAQIKR